MNKGLITRGQKEFLGKVINVIEGGFGEGKRCILASSVAEIHEVELKYINKLITNNINRFNENDLINLLSSSEELREFARKNGLITSNRTQSIYVLSERGYTKLVSMMDNTNDKKWEVMDTIIDEYFTMREVINSREQLKAQLTLKIYEGGQEGLIASKKLTDMEVEDAVKPLNSKIEKMEPAVEVLGTFIDKDGTWNIEQFAKVLGIEGMGRNNMFKWLRQQKILQGNNTPYQSYMKYFKVISTVKNGYNCIVTRVNYEGIIFLHKRLKDHGLISPKTVDDILQELNGKNLDIHN